MVTTRRQEALQQLGTPPAARLQQANDEQSPATPADAPAPAPRLPLKSALKTRRRGRGSDGQGDTTPVVTVKKTVRIDSTGNLVHEFQASLTTDGAAYGSDDDGDATPDSGARRRGRRSAPHAAGGLLWGGGTSRRSAWPRPEGTAVLGLLFTLSWMLASSALIFVNKTLMVDHGFRYPFALTALGQLSSITLAYLASALGVAPLRPAPSWQQALTRLAPVSLSFAASLFLGNVAYLGLSVAFINIMKAATPLVTLAVGLALRLEHPSRATLAGTALIALGTAISTASEAASGHLHWLSFFAFALSVVFEGLRVVLTERLLGQAKFNAMEALAHLGPCTLALLAAGAYAFEWDRGLSSEGLAIMLARPWDFAVAAVVSFLVNLFCYLAIKHVSATSFKVAGCLKNVLVVWGGILQGDVVTAKEVQGYMISLAGFLLFSASRLRGGSAGGKANGSSSRKKQQ